MDMFETHWMRMDELPQVMAPARPRRRPGPCVEDVRRELGGLDNMHVIEWCPMRLAPFEIRELSRGYTMFCPLYKGGKLVACLLRYSSWGDDYDE